MFYFSESSRSRMEGVDARLIQTADLALSISPIDFGIPLDGGIRSAERQAALFNAGASKADGYQVRSRHQTGQALDVFAYVDGAASWNKNHLTIIAGAMLEAARRLGYPVEWGGLWLSFQDLPHFQIKRG